MCPHCEDIEAGRGVNEGHHHNHNGPAYPDHIVKELEEIIVNSVSGRKGVRLRERYVDMKGQIDR